MFENGPLLVRYYVEENDDLRNKILAMLKHDKKAQLLMGNKLKQDQFKFLYDTVEIVYGSALENKLINKDEAVMTDVIPKLTAIRSLLHIRDIQLAKAAFKADEKEKAKRRGGKP